MNIIKESYEVRVTCVESNKESDFIAGATYFMKVTPLGRAVENSWGKPFMVNGHMKHNVDGKFFKFKKLK